MIFGNAPSLLGIGSALVDTLAQVSDRFLQTHEIGERGGMVMISDQQMAMLESLLDANPMRAPGGSAANTIAAAAALGTSTAFLGKLGNDEAGDFYRRRFTELGTDMHRCKVGALPTGRCLALVTPDGERTMRTDLGASVTLSPEEVTPEDFAGVSMVHLEGYLLFNGPVFQRVLDLAKLAGCRLSLDLASFEVVKATRVALWDWLESSIDVVFANEDEARALFPGLGHDFEAMAQRLGEVCDIAVVKLGKDGAVVAHGGDLIRVPTDRVSAIDTTGAGDFFAGGFLHGLLRGWPLGSCGRLGAKVGAAVVQVLGAALPPVAWNALRSEAEGLDRSLVG